MKKCIVLDLDNTLWGGIAGEEGLDGIALSLKPPGASFVAFQQALRDLYDRGVLLAINSSNNPEDAMRVINEHPNMILKDRHFAAKRINWNDKVENIRELARELNIGLDSMVFLDDSPHNRQSVRTRVPEVEAPDLPEDPAQYVRFLSSLPYFATEAITDEDKMRGNLYVTERLRREAEKHFATREDFLQSLGTEVSVSEDNPAALVRLSQMTEKTNQFNTKKRPLTQDEIRRFMENNDFAVFHAKASDQFGDHGIIAFAIVHKESHVWRLESLLMSCRVIGRGIEDAFIAEIARRAAAGGADMLAVDLEETEKNEPARQFVRRVFGESLEAPVSVFSRPAWVTVV